MTNGEGSSRVLTSASDLYNELTFKTTSLYNDPAPEPWISFLIGGISLAIASVMCVRRLSALKKALNVPLRGNILLRAMISVALDSDEPFYTIVSFAAFSFFSLGGLQLDYEATFSAMLGFFALASAGDSIRVLLAFHQATSLADVVVTSNMMKSKMRTVSTELNPTNVYEDLGRGKMIVFVVFVTQCILVSFVVTDIFNTRTHNCFDGTSNCPVVGTFGSWCFYILGIFMACVYLLGPKTSFGQSEQNPSFWLQLLLAAKTTGAKCIWYEPVSDRIMENPLSPNDWRIWVRFIMSYLINGVGFHILVHALPIQVAGQSTFTGVVFRAVGMLYLVDLDDTPGYTLTVVEAPKPVEEVEPSKGEDDELEVKPTDDTEPEPASPIPIFTPINAAVNFEASAMSEEAELIIQEARLKLDALATRGVTASNAEGGRQPMSRVSNMVSTRLFVLAGSANEPEIDVHENAPSNGQENGQESSDMGNDNNRGISFADAGGGSGNEPTV